MSADKLAATFHGDPAQARIDDLAIDRAARLVKVTAEPRPEQALRAHVADLLTDVDHFDGCKANPDCDCDFCVCTCLIGRLHWAINAEQVTT